MPRIYLDAPRGACPFINPKRQQPSKKDNEIDEGIVTVNEGRKLKQKFCERCKVFTLNMNKHYESDQHKVSFGIIIIFIIISTNYHSTL